MSTPPPPIEADLVKVYYEPTANTTAAARTGGSGAVGRGENSSSNVVVLHRMVDSAAAIVVPDATYYAAAANDNGGTNDISIPRLLHGPGTGASGGDVITTIERINDAMTAVTVTRMDGTRVATFDLPHFTNNDDPPSKRMQRNEGGGRRMTTTANDDTAGWDDGYTREIMCWTTFQSGNRSKGNSTTTNNTRKMLCVLSNPTTLHIFDVLGDAASLATTNSSNADDDEYDGGGPSGHTIPLPFIASSIFSNGDDGLLISRLPSVVDYDNIAAAARTANDVTGAGNIDGTTVIGKILPATPKVLQQQQQQQHNRRNNDEDNDYNDDNDDVSLEGPPKPLRFPDGTLNNPMMGSFFATATTTNANANLPPAPSSTMAMDVDGNDIDNDIDNYADAIINNGIVVVEDGGDVPCLFSLRHPLDEIYPLAVVVMGSAAAAANNEENESAADTGNDNESSSSVRLFSNVLETLVHVGSPRLFHGTIPSTIITTTSSSSSTGPTICVTYNSQLDRHTFWSLSHTISPVEDVPLWKSTGRRWNQLSVESIMEKDEDMMGIDNEDHERQQQQQQQQQQWNQQGGGGDLLSSSYIHPHFTLSKLYVENDDTTNFIHANNDDNNDGHIDNGDSYNEVERYKRHVFLATDMLGRGDLVLCLFKPNHHYRTITVADESSSSSSTDEPAILRCYSLGLHFNQEGFVVSIQSVSHLVDLPCSSARPVQSIPIPLAPFAAKRKDGINNNGKRHTSRYQNADNDTMAMDILIVRQQQQDDKDCKDKMRIMTSLYRAGVIHITDFTIRPHQKSHPILKSLTSCKPIFVRLQNSVENRVDIRLLLPSSAESTVNSGNDREHDKVRKGQGCQQDRPRVVIVRATFTLLINTSCLTETAVRAIESSVICPKRECSLQSQGSHVSILETMLPLMLRADTVRLFQQLYKQHESNEIKNTFRKVEDHSWYSLTEVVLNLLGMNVRDSDEEGTCAKSPTSAWEALLLSDYHAAFCAGEGRLLFGDDINTVVDSKKRDACGPSCDVTSLSSLVCARQLVIEAKERATHDNDRHVVTMPELYKQRIFDALHLLHEDSRLVSASRGFQWTRRIGTLLLHVSEQMSPLMIDYEDHYNRMLGNSRCLSNARDSYFVHSENKCRVSSFMTPPCIMTWLDGILQSDGDDILVDDVHGVAEYNILFETGLNGLCSTTWLVLRLFTSLFCRNLHAGFDRNLHDRLTILAMLDEGIFRPSQLQDELPIGVVLPLLEAIRRCFLDPPQVESTVDCWPAAAYDMIGRNDLATFMSQSMMSSSSSNKVESDGGSPEVADPDNDGLVGLEHFSSMIFPDDNRVREAVRLLRSSRPLFLRVVRPVELSDHEYERSKQDKLLLLCRRSIALPLGRGMLTLGTHHAPTAEQLLIPSIVMAGRVPPMNGTLALDMSTCPSNYRVWPEFHNGVAAGLRLPCASEDMNYKAITRTWIKFNKPVHVVENVAGATGANSAQTTTPSYAHGGFLMALGLRGYLSALTTIDLTDYLTQGTITTTVGIFLGMSANKRGSCDPSISKMLCLHVPSLLPPSFLPMDLASPVQAASVASIGLLYQASSHRLMTEFLLNEMGRQPIKDQNSNDRESFALVCGLALGMVNLKGGTSTVSGLEDLRIEERLQCYITGSVNRGEFNGRHENVERSAGSGNQGEMDWNSRIDEVTSSINTDITASGATLALGLMYIRSQNASVAASLQLPDTHFLLDYSRPDMLALRVISRSLILWNDITPTSIWIDIQIPSIVKSSINLMKNAAQRAINIAAGGDIMDEHGDTGDYEVVKKDMIDFDPHAIRQANAYIISGACFSLGLKYAGSANRAAAAAIIERALWLLELRDNKDAVSLIQRPDNSTLVTCLCTAAISLAMVMSGTGDLDSFRLFRALRWKCDDGTLYGTHMAFGAAIGLLFLGGGKCTLGNSPEDVAVLIAAFYPHFPILSSDNQYHLQALRHLYVLAVHERILEACDVDTNQKICIPIELSVKDSSEVINTSLPFLVANDSNLIRLRSKSERYYPIDINVQDWSNCGKISTLFFKRKAGHLSYLQDPNGLRSLSMQQVGIADNKSLLNSIKMFSGDAKLTAFAKYFCSSSFIDNKSVERRCSNIAYEILKEGKSSDILALYMQIYGMIDSIGRRERLDIEDVFSAKLMRTYVESRQRLSNDSMSSSLINREILSQLFEVIDDLFCDVDSALLMSLTRGNPEKWWERDNRYFFSAFLAWNGVPLKR